MVTSLKLVFIGEAVSGFGGMETVISNVIHTFEDNTPKINSEMFFFCRNNRMDKAWLKKIKYTQSFSNIKLSFLRRAKHIYNFSQWLKEASPDIVICIDVISCLYASKARKKSGRYFTIFSWPHFSLDHKKHAECITYADYHLAISSGIKKQMMARGISEQNISIVYNPVSIKKVIVPPPGRNKPAVFLYVGRLKFEGQKRVKDLFDGLVCTTGEWQLHIIGDGSDLEKCQAYSRELGIDERVIWYGWQSAPWQFVQQKVKNVTALLLTSAFEGFPMTLLEAMSYGIPCISSDCMSGPRDMIKPGINGELYSSGAIDEFIEHLNRVISGEVKYQHDIIPGTIERFYDVLYFKNFNNAIFSKLKK